MVKKICAVLIVAFMSFSFALPVFAADDVAVDEASLIDVWDLTSYVYESWDLLDEAAQSLRSAYSDYFRLMFDEDIDTWTYITGMLQTQVWDIPIAWLRTTKAGMYVLKMDDSKVYAIIDGVLTVYDLASNAISYLTGDDAVADPVPLLPTSWIETIPPEKLPGGSGSGSGSGSSSSNSSVDMSGIISTLTEGVGGVFTITGSAFDFITDHALTMLMVCLSFAGAGLGFVARAFSTSRK